ncbi:alpha/beta hydrolase family protein [Arenibacter echinorum]|uniref:Cephalosporin-C deacetylase-like acetyl esterase n=1 Tax=Arenibacter echinorum TaxID=440515 RepID=A0A327R9I6_9FLAO|nr:acetylxylan esterase [Arenibacter echinorum]RAJ12274.1 cephalosporin-C deacetylase-like acetyl esterase [Arenibacter echinorum]
MFKRFKHQALSLVVFLMFLLAPCLGWSQTNYSVLDFWKYYSDAENLLYKQQAELSFESMDKRKESISMLRTQEDWTERQQLVKNKLMQSVGPFPPKTNLNPVVTKRIKKEGYSVEKMYFESMPGVKVTAAFFIPQGKKRNLPTIIYCSGHSDLGFRSDVYQHVILNLVKKGFAVFAFDPYGQGERLQYFDEKEGKSRFSPTREHSYPGAQLFINGASTAKYMIWDGIRAVDYLLTRKEVDPDRIGITGRSGGGTQSSHIAAFDDRIKASAPECYITTLEYQLKSGGPQDAEQNFPKGIQLGLDHADLLEVRAPKPTLMITTTLDIFSIQGARDTYKETQLAYKAFGKEENMMMVEDNAGHQSTLKNREAMYAFFQKHLDNPGDSKDEEVVIFPVEELYVTETGQLSTSVGSKFLFDVNSDVANKNMEVLNGDRKNMDQHLIDLKQKVQQISGYTQGATKGKLIFSGKTEFETYYLNKYLIEQPGDNIIPFVAFVPKQATKLSALYLDNIADKKSDEAYSVPIHLVKKGVTVIVPDMPGYGELGPGYLKGDAYFENTSYNQWFAGILNGKSTIALHVEAIETLLEVCKTNLKLDDKEFMGISKGGFNSSLLHAAVSGVEFSRMLFLDPMLSFQYVVSNKDYNPAHIPFTVAGALPHYDLPDLSAAFAPNKLMLVQETDGDAMDSEYPQTYDFVKEHYGSMNKANNFSVEKINSRREATDLINEFITDL